MSHRSQSVNFAVFDRDRSTWPCLVRNCVDAVVFVTPQHLARFFVNAVDAFELFGVGHTVHHINAARRNCGSCVARANGDPPFDLKSVLREPLKNSRFIPGTIAMNPSPLRPVISQQGRNEGQVDKKDAEQSASGLTLVDHDTAVQSFPGML